MLSETEPPEDPTDFSCNFAFDEATCSIGNWVQITLEAERSECWHAIVAMASVASASRRTSWRRP